jgi:NTP pyrophosphatase (non-canonical NTP hydrolase)
MKSLSDLAEHLRVFARARDWEQFHTPKNLAASIAVEAGELLEHFQWTTAEPVEGEVKRKVSHEMADVLIYLVRLADILDVNLLEAASAKMDESAAKYPVEKSKGNALKYTEFQ